MVMLLIFLIIGILFIPFKVETTVHNNSIKMDLLVFKLKIKILKKRDLINFEEKTDKKIKKSRVYKVLKDKVNEQKYYLKKIDFFKISKKILKLLDVSIYTKIEFGFDRKDFTAILYGLLSSVFPILKEVLNIYICIKDFNFYSYPHFNKNTFDFITIISIKSNLFNTIFIIFLVVKEILLIRKKFKNEQREC